MNLDISICTKKYLFEPRTQIKKNHHNHCQFEPYSTISLKIEFFPQLDFPVSLYQKREGGVRILRKQILFQQLFQQPLNIKIISYSKMFYTLIHIVINIQYSTTLVAFSNAIFQPRSSYFQRHETHPLDLRFIVEGGVCVIDWQNQTGLEPTNN